MKQVYLCYLLLWKLMEEKKKLPVDVSGASFIIEEHKPISRIVVHLELKKENGLVILDLTHTRSRQEWFWFEDGFLPTHRE